MTVLNAERLRELLHYDPETGVCTWRVRPASARTMKRRKAGGRARYDGKAAGCVNKSNGYRNIMVAGRTYYTHRLAWLYVDGKWPKDEIDHINRDPSDNRFCNLRECSRAQYQANSYTSTGYLKGAYWDHGKWKAGIHVNGRTRDLGRFDDPQDAALAHATAACAIYGAFAKPQWRDVLADMRGVLEP